MLKNIFTSVGPKKQAYMIRNFVNNQPSNIPHTNLIWYRASIVSFQRSNRMVTATNLMVIANDT